MKSERTYIPAAGRDLFLPLYDIITKFLGMAEAREPLLNQAGLSAGQRVLDIGCGTGRLVVDLKRKYPDIEVVGLDPDLKALSRARRHAERAAVSVDFEQGFSDALAYASDSFDGVFSSFMFHHLPSDEKEKTVREIRRVLKGGGWFSLLDFEAAEDGKHRALSHLLQSHAHLKDNSEGRIVEMLTQAGFADVHKSGERPVFFGLARVGYYQSSLPN
jgi:Methylase involved in ubiquinone/menaquinone biosynthesis